MGHQERGPRLARGTGAGGGVGRSSGNRVEECRAQTEAGASRDPHQGWDPGVWGPCRGPGPGPVEACSQSRAAGPLEPRLAQIRVGGGVRRIVDDRGEELQGLHRFPEWGGRSASAWAGMRGQRGWRAGEGVERGSGSEKRRVVGVGMNVGPAPGPGPGWGPEQGNRSMGLVWGRQ